MRLAELSARSGLTTATIKYYLRAGLLPRGTTQSSTWASYDEDHLRRLRLVRALTDVAGLSLEEVRGVVDAVADSSPTTRFAEPPSGPSRRTWHGIPQRPPSNESTDCSPAMAGRSTPVARTDELASALDTLDELEFAATDEVLDAYADALESIAEIEVARVAAEAEPVVAAERPPWSARCSTNRYFSPCAGWPTKRYPHDHDRCCGLPLYCGSTSRTPVSAWRSAAMATSNQRPITGEGRRRPRTIPPRRGRGARRSSP